MSKEQFRLEDLQDSEKAIGQIYPVLRDDRGEIIDGYHRKRVDPKWKETILKTADAIQTMRLRVHLNLKRRDVPESEKKEWVHRTRELLIETGLKGTQKEIAGALGQSQHWVSLYDEIPTRPHKEHEITRRSISFNVWGLQPHSWKGLVQKADPEQPEKEFYHGLTPAFVIENLLTLYKPKRVLDSMAGAGTTGWVCSKNGIECDQFDLYPFKENVKLGDAEDPPIKGPFDLIFNHVPYLNMVEYGKDSKDLSNMQLDGFQKKMGRIFQTNYALLGAEGVYAVLIGDKRDKGRLLPLTAMITMLGPETGFYLYDSAIKITGEAESAGGLIAYRSAKFGFMVQTYDTVLIFKKE